MHVLDCWLAGVSEFYQFSIGWWTLCSPNNFAPWNTLLNTFYSLTHFTPQHTLAPQHTLLPGILCSLEHFAHLWNTLTPWNTLLLRTLCFKCFRVQRMLRRTIYKLDKCFREQSVPRSRVFQEAKCAEKQSVLGSKVLNKEKSVLRSKLCWGAKCSREQNVLSKMCWEAKCPQEGKCSREQSVHQPYKPHQILEFFVQTC